MLRAVAGRALVISSAALVLLAAGYLAGALPAAALALGLGVLAVGVTAVQPSLIPLITLPTLVVVLRVGGGEINFAFSDLMLAVATIPAIVLARRPFSPHLRTMLWTAVVYQFVTLLTVINNPYAANIVEWVSRRRPGSRWSSRRLVRRLERLRPGRYAPAARRR